MKSNCEFCSGNLVDSHNLNSFRVHYCADCWCSSLSKLPSEDEVNKYYQGFRFEINDSQLRKIQTTSIRLWMKSYLSEKTGMMLDIGGGGGFFAKAFEDFGLGTSYYIDLDSEACAYAKDQLKLKNVICDRVENLDFHMSGMKFDFIYCRHVIEHLVDPVSMIKASAQLLNDNGTFVVQCPNGLSKEGFLYPKYWWKFLAKVRNSNDWTTLYSLIFSLSKKHGWGLDPIRHLWAVTGKGMKMIFQCSDEFSVNVYTKSLIDPVFSPYWRPRSFMDRCSAILSRIFIGKRFEGVHLITEIKRKNPDIPKKNSTGN